MSKSLDIKFIVSIFLLMIFPISSAYYEALRMAQLPKKQHAILGLTAMTTTVATMNLSFTLIGQIDPNSFSKVNLIPVLFLFIIGITIRRKFPNLFLKVFLKNNIKNSE